MARAVGPDCRPEVQATRRGSSIPSYKPGATLALMRSVMGQYTCSGCLGSTPDFAVIPGSGTWEHCGKIHLKARGLFQLWLLLVPLRKPTEGRMLSVLK